MASNDVADSFYIQVLQGLNIPVNATTLQFFKNWHQNELTTNVGGGLTYNPFNTTRQVPGSTPLSGNPSGNNGHPVQVYQNEQQGVQATVDTLKQSQYKNLVADLKSLKTMPYTDSKGASRPFLKASADLVTSPWGTHTIIDPLNGQPVNNGGGTIVLPDYGVGPTLTLPGAKNTIPPGYGSVGGVTETPLASFAWLGQALKIGLGVLLILVGVYVLTNGKAVTIATNAVKSGEVPE